MCTLALLSRQVKTDTMGRMDTTDLIRALIDAKVAGRVPFFVNATCGTTVLGAFDPLKEIASICESEGMWLHVDVRNQARESCAIDRGVIDR